jgi:ssDNA-binding Zn-finger/Zn-ribbon topoisomerase 1
MEKTRKICPDCKDTEYPLNSEVGPCPVCGAELIVEVEEVKEKKVDAKGKK